jgi:hypothetical protein
MSIAIPAQCYACARLDRSRLATKTLPGEQSRPVVDKCEAFPDGIPTEIALGADHRKPFDGDHGKQFEQLATDDGQSAFVDWTAYKGA